MAFANFLQFSDDACETILSHSNDFPELINKTIKKINNEKSHNKRFNSILKYNLINHLYEVFQERYKKLNQPYRKLIPIEPIQKLDKELIKKKNN